MSISVIIPTYNEAQSIGACIDSLFKQDSVFELIIVDDGSTDDTLSIVSEKLKAKKNALFLKQRHLGPAAARNLGAQKASGDILVFVDADMTFATNFLVELTKSIEEKKTQGTFTKEEYVANWENIWAKCWNFNQGIFTNRRIPQDYPNTAPVFRAILAKEFRRVHGYTIGVGWTDDWTLSRKLGYKSTATRAICYHANPSSLQEAFVQARWVGKNEFITGTLSRIIRNSIRYSLLGSLFYGLQVAFQTKTPSFLLFKFVYDFAISVSILESFGGTDKNK